MNNIKQYILQQSKQFGVEAVCFGNNLTNAEIAIILEYPSEQDCKTGYALSGTAGNYIFKHLEKYGITKDKCYTTCAIKRKIKAFSDEFTKISNTECNLWKTLLEIELKSLKNLKYVIALGKYSLKMLFKRIGLIIKFD